MNPDPCTTHQSSRGGYETNSSIYRWRDAAQWHGAIEYSDAFSPEAHFPVRTLAQVPFTQLKP